MPKEIIDSKYAGQTVTDLDTGKSVVLETTYAHVGWTKDREHVEVGVLKLPEGDSATPHEGWFVQLDRPGINRLIRALRKARDDAFGADA